MQNAHEQLHDAGEEAEQHGEVGVPLGDLLVGHEGHQRRGTDGDLLAGTKHHADEASHERRVQPVLNKQRNQIMTKGNYEDKQVIR